MATPARVQEAETLRAFVASAGRRDRLIRVPATRNRVTELARALAHEDLWDDRWVLDLPAHHQNAASIGTILRERGAPPACGVLGGTQDGQEIELAAALDAIVGVLDACLVICVPGRLAYHESEEPGRRVVLAR
jgi:hypothetical protein